MKNQINISNLTPEQIEEVRQQLKAFDEQPKTIMDKVKSWEDACDIINPSYWLSDEPKIEHCTFGDATKICVPSEKHAKSILATSQLMVIAEALNEGNVDNEVWVFWDGGEFQCSQNSYGLKYGIIRFKNIPIGEYAITQFKDLWYDYFMIDNPTKQ